MTVGTVERMETSLGWGETPPPGGKVQILNVEKVSDELSTTP